MKNLTRMAALWAGLACTGSMWGCGGGASVIPGKVIRGDISFIVAVDATDPRLSGEGIEGATVDVYSASDRGATLLAHSVSNAKGNISLSIKESDVLLHPAEFDADKPGFARTTMVMSIPASDKRVLVILKPGGASPAR